jgi:hypothetical protein
MRQDAVERTLMISNLANPPQQGEYRDLVGDLFPETYPFDYSRIFDYRYFWIKYYISQRNIFTIAKKYDFSRLIDLLGLTMLTMKCFAMLSRQKSSICPRLKSTS